MDGILLEKMQSSVHDKCIYILVFKLVDGIKYESSRDVKCAENISWKETNWKDYIRVFPQKLGVVFPQNGWFVMENPIKMDDLGVTPIFGNTHIWIYPINLKRNRLCKHPLKILAFFVV